MLFLLAGVAALWAGPLLLRVLSRAPWCVALIDAFVMVTMGGLVFLHMIPHAIEGAGWKALVAAGLGALAPLLLHPMGGHGHGHGHTEDVKPMLSMAVLALTLHGFFDGASLSGLVVAGTEPGTEASLMAWALVMHRVLEGLAVWWLVRPAQGVWAACAALCVMAAGAAAGFYAVDVAFQAASQEVLSIMQAMVAASLMHVVLRHAPVSESSSGGIRLNRWMSAAGVACASVVLATWGHSDTDHVHDDALWARVGVWGAACALPVLLGHVCAWKERSFRGTGGFLSNAVHMLGPSPAWACVSVWLTWVLIGPWFALLRVMWAVGLVLLDSPVAVPSKHASSHASGVAHVFEHSVHPHASWMLAGVALAALISPEGAAVLKECPVLLQPVLAVLVVGPFRIHPVAVTCVAGALAMQGVSLGACMAMLLVAPLSLWRDGHVVWRSSLVAAMMCVFAGYATQLMCGVYGGALGGLRLTWWGMLCGGVLCVVYAVSLCLQGARSFIEPVTGASKHMHV